MNSWSWRLRLWQDSLPPIRGISSSATAWPPSPRFHPASRHWSGGAGRARPQRLPGAAFRAGVFGLLSFVALLWHPLRAVAGMGKALQRGRAPGAPVLALCIAGYAVVCLTDNMLYYLAFNWYFLVPGRAGACEKPRLRSCRHEILRHHPFLQFRQDHQPHAGGPAQAAEPRVHPGHPGGGLVGRRGNQAPARAGRGSAFARGARGGQGHAGGGQEFGGGARRRRNPGLRGFRRLSATTGSCASRSPAKAAGGRAADRSKLPRVPGEKPPGRRAVLLQFNEFMPGAGSLVKCSCPR